mgnify:CR=1 FL=1
MAVYTDIYSSKLYMPSRVKYKPFVLPSSYEELNNYVKTNKKELTQLVISSIEFALKNELPMIEVFNFKNSDFVVTLSHSEFRENINHIYNFYINEELYELCPRVKQVESLLDNPKSSNEKIKKTTRHKSNCSSEEQDQESD